MLYEGERQTNDMPDDKQMTHQVANLLSDTRHEINQTLIRTLADTRTEHLFTFVTCVKSNKNAAFAKSR